MPVRLMRPPCKLHTLLLAGLWAGAWQFSELATAQTPAAQPVVSVQVAADTGGPAWATLNPEQRSALRPLEPSWNSLTLGQKRKWIVVAQNFKNLPADEQSKIHDRMAAWAALSPRDREQARLNFAQSKNVAPADRAATWEAYQALSEQERQALAAQAPKKPPGAAIATKPVAADKLAPVPATRLIPPQQRQPATARNNLDRNTLLPLPDNADIKSEGP